MFLQQALPSSNHRRIKGFGAKVLARGPITPIVGVANATLRPAFLKSVSRRFDS